MKFVYGATAGQILSQLPFLGQVLDDAFYKEEPLLLQNVARILEAALAENFFGRYRYIIFHPPGLGQLTSPWS